LRIVALNGSLRKQSSNAALLRAAMRVAPEGVEIVLYEDVASLPHFNPDLDAEGSEPPHSVRELRQLLIDADAILISSPEYAHGVPGAFKNVLDWLVSTGELVDKPVALLNASPVGGTYAQNALLETLRTMNWRIIEEATLSEPWVTRKIVGELEDEPALMTLRNAVTALAQSTSETRPSAF
jgi:chromate reductase, NAD(P)H dehydrogenase (quinone)